MLSACCQGAKSYGAVYLCQSSQAKEADGPQRRLFPGQTTVSGDGSRRDGSRIVAPRGAALPDTAVAVTSSAITGGARRLIVQRSGIVCLQAGKEACTRS